MSTFALPILFDSVVARFAVINVQCTQIFSFTAPDRVITTTNRITWQPGSPSGALGEMGPPRGVGRNPRSVGTLFELFTCELHSVDVSALQNDLKQYEAVRKLYDHWVSACERAAHGTFKIKSAEYLPKKLLTRGACIQAVCTIEAAVFSQPEPQPTAPVDAQAEVTLSELDYSDTFKAPSDS